VVAQRAARRGTVSRVASRPYRLTLQGELGEPARQAFEGEAVALEGGNTILIARDQAELMALMRRVSALGLTLLSATASDERTYRVS
jgi:hypothetical protein